jgi:hypothetical protein
LTMKIFIVDNGKMTSSVHLYDTRKELCKG